MMGIKLMKKKFWSTCAFMKKSRHGDGIGKM